MSMEIIDFPEVQILGNDAKIRIDKTYYQLGAYDHSGVFVWSEDGARRRDEILESRKPVVEEPVVESVKDDDLAAAKARNAARHKKNKGR